MKMHLYVIYLLWNSPISEVSSNLFSTLLWIPKLLKIVFYCLFWWDRLKEKKKTFLQSLICLNTWPHVGGAFGEVLNDGSLLEKFFIRAVPPTSIPSLLLLPLVEDMPHYLLVQHLQQHDRFSLWKYKPK